MIKSKRAYIYADGIVKGDYSKLNIIKKLKKKYKAPKYVIKQCKEFLEIANGKNERYFVDEKKLNKVEKILKALVMPKGSKLGQSLYECTCDYQWFLYTNIFAVVERENPNIRKYQIVLLELARKNYKALSLDSDIPTPNGWKKMRDIKVGDYIFARDGNPTKVIGESEIFNKPMMEVEFEDGEIVKASEDHIWTVITKTSRKTYNSKTKHIGKAKLYRENGLYELTTKDMLNDYVRVRADGKGSEYKYRIPMNEPINYSHKELPIDPYLLGVWLGDGTSERPHITCGYKDIDEMISNLSGCGYKCEIIDCKDRSPYIFVDRHKNDGKSFRNDKNALIKKMTYLNLIKNKHIPRIYLESSIDQRWELLKGLMDTDGTVLPCKECVFVQKSKLLTDNVLELINSLGIKAKAIKFKPILNGKKCGEAYRIQFFVDKAHTCFKLKRKTDRLKDKLSDRMKYKSVIRVSKIDKCESKCLMVDNKEHLFLTGKHFTATHNTYSIATIFTILLLLEPQFSKIFSVAPSGELSGLVKEALEETIKASPMIYYQNGIDEDDGFNFKILNTGTKCLLNSNFFKPLNYTNSRFDGKEPNAFLADEVGALPIPYPVEAMKTGQKLLKNKLGCIVSTKYPRVDNPFEDYVNQAKSILDKKINDEHFFSLLYEPDNTKKWDSDNLILMQSNPALIENEDLWNGLLKDREEAIAFDFKRENFITKSCNIIYQGIGTENYIPIEEVKECEVETIDWTGVEVEVGVDLSMTNDNVAVAIAGLDDEDIIAEVMIFIPEGRINEKSANERVDYRQRIEAGECIACGDMVIDYKTVENYVFDLEKNKGCIIDQIGYDRWNALSSAQKWEEKYNTVEIKQHSSVLHAPTKLLKEYVAKKQIRIKKSKLLEINFENCRLNYDTNLNMFVNKKKSMGKVDGVIALINALSLLQIKIDEGITWGAMF